MIIIGNVNTEYLSWSLLKAQANVGIMTCMYRPRGRNCCWRSDIEAFNLFPANPRSYLSISVHILYDDYLLYGDYIYKF